MIITIGSDGNNLESAVAKRFGHANYYIVYNAVDKTFEAVENINEDHTHSILYELADKGTNACIVGNIGPHAYDIASKNCKIYLARKMSVKEAIEKFEAGELKELTEPTVKRNIRHK